MVTETVPQSPPADSEHTAKVRPTVCALGLWVRKSEMFREVGVPKGASAQKKAVFKRAHCTGSYEGQTVIF